MTKGYTDTFLSFHIFLISRAKFSYFAIFSVKYYYYYYYYYYFQVTLCHKLAFPSPNDIHGCAWLKIIQINSIQFNFSFINVHSANYKTNTKSTKLTEHSAILVQITVTSSQLH